MGLSKVARWTVLRYCFSYINALTDTLIVREAIDKDETKDNLTHNGCGSLLLKFYGNSSHLESKHKFTALN